MKANSVGLETDIYLSQEQIKSLENSAIKGMLKFREVNDNKTRRDIPFEIDCNKSQEESLKVIIEPSQTYFGYADKVTYIINDYLYNKLVTTGSCGDRFLGAGKLLIFIE
jgi:hypothetical protein